MSLPVQRCSVDYLDWGHFNSGFSVLHMVLRVISAMGECEAG